MSRTHRSILVFGLLSSFVGILLIVSPTLGGAVTLSGVVRTAPIALTGVLAVVLAAVYLFGEIRSMSVSEDGQQTESSELPSPENRPRYEHPGTAFARRLEAIEWTDRRAEDPEARLALRAELRQMAITVLSRTERWTRTDIETRLDEGRWTENPHAAAFFADDVVPSLSLRQRLRSLRSTEPPFTRRARHAVAELATRFDEGDVTPALSDAARTSLNDPPTVTTRRYWPSDTTEDSRESTTDRTRGVTAAALAAGGLGIVTLHPALLLLALFGITVSGYTRIVPSPTETVSITRTVSDAEPNPEKPVEVTVSIQNTSDATIADLRLIDGVPAGLTVTEGSPRFTTALRPGKEATFTYTVEAVHGVHAFDPALLITRDVSGVRKRETLHRSSPTTITCHPSECSMPEVGLRQQTTVHPGQSRSAIKGSGVEFHSVREYRPGDPLSRIDWKRKAKTGEFTTIDFREPHLENVLLVIDARAEAYLEPAGECDEPIVQRSVTAGHALASQLLSDSIPVGIAALSPRSCWLLPSAGDVHRRRIRETLSGDDAFAWNAPEGEFDATEAVRELYQRVRPDTQIIFISPLCDDEATAVVRRLDAYGYAVSVISPDPTAPESATSTLDCGTAYASLTRRLRLSDLRGVDIPVVDWNPSEPFAEVMHRES
ncbi:DUF58 domain-containing protein (plasmid) [Haloferax mediterranei ATCC 33500]|uniref:DUF58 domain-containing protein n=1 Tax=Haloferax mediterranei (strain ATCC 33500 / DSM 1411 / JCM 8866 / NBRC 14739 / NCIMB 2177 / R-4) TaxID=523841 RepID=I3RA28_HALMT|nr:DUF58 domain-containing protein [Haloferax mediterranei]AFK21088.1 hypothetical protein HFX_5256 [Haloferax mediterranei ATCC 33500]AHZ24323.1 hypothetical protein BM92_19180 [Haloferax mediterranei ATCC 33500]EMA05409.1 hypothetical protein C439_01380 [Haloferax mediterranei ATCC 33500]MDX5989793.1 DUF58 domain-containing protein [Haloferax mediterranei ATCC 33500]QCQ77237.1 DUF58 domain-containing protein [Haloferax mediterranei ATCC 33500]